MLMGKETTKYPRHKAVEDIVGLLHLSTQHELEVVQGLRLRRCPRTPYPDGLLREYAGRTSTIPLSCVQRV